MRRVSAIVRQTHSRVPTGDDDDDDGTTSSWRLVHLQETLVPDNGPHDAGTTLSQSGQRRDGQQHDGPPLNGRDGSRGPQHLHPTRAGGASSKSVPSTRRFIAPQSVLDKFGAKPLLEKSSSGPDDSTGSTNSLVGLSIEGWDIATSQGSIGDQFWFEQALQELEPLAQCRKQTSSRSQGEDGKGRKLVLPEMVFPLAHVVLERSVEVDEDHHADESGQPHDHDVFVSWDAMEALKEWSRAHQAIPMPTDSGTSSDAHDAISTLVSSSTSFRGVSVLQSSDAALWKQKQRESDSANHDDGNNNNDSSRNLGRIRNSEFHYDWTYSTPFSGLTFLSASLKWQPLPQSAMPVYLLTDTSVPILYYDHIVLFEDDLHDNGAVEYTIKVRIMPHCAYVLARLFVRVDHVLVRVRDARWLVDFGIAGFGGNPKGKMLYRDITWREAAWNDLGPRYQLPSTVRAWTTTSMTAESQAFQTLLSKLPLVDAKQMPADIIPHSQLCYYSEGRV